MKYDRIMIKIVVNGIIAKVGCREFVFTDPAEFLRTLGSYINDPELTIKRWTKEYPELEYPLTPTGECQTERIGLQEDTIGIGDGRR